MKLFQIPFSHNCVKVKRALELKEIEHETVDVRPMDRRPVLAATGQRMVPALVDGERRIADSTAILLHLEEAYPQRPLLPAGAVERAEVLVLEDWADEAFMKRVRRMAYYQVLSEPGRLEALLLSGAGPVKRWVTGRVARRAIRRHLGISERRHRSDESETRRLARLAVDRLGGRGNLVGESTTIADLALASMSGPLAVCSVKDDEAVRALVAWGREILGPLAEHYRE